MFRLLGLNSSLGFRDFELGFRACTVPWGFDSRIGVSGFRLRFLASRMRHSLVSSGDIARPRVREQQQQLQKQQQYKTKQENMVTVRTATTTITGVRTVIT